MRGRCTAADALRNTFFMNASPPAPPGIWPSIRAAFRQNRVPWVALNALVAALVASYFFIPEVAGAWAAVGAFKERWSYLFSLVSTVFSAVLLPSAVQAMMGVLPDAGRVARILTLAAFWGYRGMEIDLFYKLQAVLFGSGNDPLTLVKKVAFDQFVYSTLWAVPTYVIALRWVDLGRSWRLTWASLDRRFWTVTYPSILVTNWLIWIPAVSLVYSLPTGLQFPLFAVVMCFFILLVSLLARGDGADGPKTELK